MEHFLSRTKKDEGFALVLTVIQDPVGLVCQHRTNFFPQIWPFSTHLCRACCGHLILLNTKHFTLWRQAFVALNLLAYFSRNLTFAFDASSTKCVKSCHIMHLFNLLLLATAVVAGPKADNSSPRTVSALRSKLSSLDCKLETQAVEKLKAVETNNSSTSCVDAVGAFDHVS